MSHLCGLSICRKYMLIPRLGYSFEKFVLELQLEVFKSRIHVQHRTIRDRTGYCLQTWKRGPLRAPLFFENVDFWCSWPLYEARYAVTVTVSIIVLL